MKSRTSHLYRGVIIYLCVILPLSLFPVQGTAQNSKAQKKVQVQLGKPQVWSIGQAHYLLANMRRVNRDLKTHMPSPDELNPSAANATRIQILKTLVGGEVQFSQKDAIENQAAIRQNQESLINRDQAQAALPAKERDLKRLNEELLRINTDIAEKQAKVDRLKAGRDALARPTATPPVFAPPPTKEEDDLAIEVAKLTVVKNDIERRRNEAATEVTSLKSTANGTVGGPTLKEPQFSTAPRQLVGDLAPLVSKALDKAATTTPSVAASIALDNYIAMQYEIIAKQMTLLRDELGPEERVIFVELPTSFYTIPCKADNHMIQLRWEVEEYLEDDDFLAGEGKQGLRTDFEDVERQKLKELNTFKVSQSNFKTLQADDRQTLLTKLEKELIEDDYSYRWKSVRGSARDVAGQQKERINYAMSNFVFGADESRRYAVRALDIIPRQSALNVNSTYNTVSQVNFLGALKFITGLGIKVDYQRQQELYEQYLQQEVFASGFGKGSGTFGWTFAPLPGTKRVAPGVRTTYAMLAVPRKASALQLKVKAITYPKRGTPDYDEGSPQVVAEETMIVRIPNAFTENFYVKEAIYTPVRKGERVGVLVKGDYFSPQIGVAVNGIPLTRALSLTSNENLDATALPAAVGGVQGVFELVNSNELFMTFSVADRNIATPTITLVTPEKTSAINFFDIKINYHSGFDSLQKISKTEPMFVDDFEVAQKLQVIGGGNQRPSPDKLPVPYIKTRLEGKGLRRSAEIYVDDSSTPLKHLEDIEKELNEKMVKWKVDKDVEMKIAKDKKEYEKRVEDNKVVGFDPPPPLEPEDRSRLAIEALEKLRKDLADDYMNEAGNKLQAQGKKLTSTEKERLRKLRLEELNDPRVFFDAFYKKFASEFIEEQIKKISAEKLEKLRQEYLEAIKKQETTLAAEAAEKKAQQKANEAIKREAEQQVELFKTPLPNVEYADQDSTGAYILYFRQPQKAKWTVRYRNNTKQGFEEKVFEVERAVPSAHKLVSHTPVEAGKAKVTLEFSTDDNVKNPITDINIPDSDEGIPDPENGQLTDLGDGKYRRSFIVKPEEGNLRAQITATVKRKDMAAQKVTITLHPGKPNITKIENPNNPDKKASGYVDEEPVVVIKGTNLQRVDKIFFGNKEATKFGDPSPTEIYVTVPKGEHLIDIKEKQVPVRVVTDAASGKSFSSNVVFYTYIENIVPPKPESPRRGGRTTIKVTVPATPKSPTKAN